jgi:hypothetical protein
MSTKRKFLTYIAGDVETEWNTYYYENRRNSVRNTNALSVRELSSKSSIILCIQKARWQGFIPLCQKQLFRGDEETEWCWTALSIMYGFVAIESPVWR